MNYQIIASYPELNSFISNILPDLQPNECFYVCLFARNKYCPELTHIKADKAQLKRFTTTKEFLIQKLQQLECPLGAYKQKEFPVPQHALAVYISINPRSYIKAAHKSLITLATLIGKGADGYNPHQHVLSDIQQSCSRKIYSDFDIDGPLNIPLSSGVGLYAPLILKTKSGYHVLIQHSLIPEEYKNSWYQDVVRTLKPDKAGDQLIPIPGCFQGGLDFFPYFI